MLKAYLAYIGHELVALVCIALAFAAVYMLLWVVQLSVEITHTWWRAGRQERLVRRGVRLAVERVREHERAHRG